MADKSKKKQYTGNERMDSTTQTILVVVVAVIAIILAYILQNALHLDTVNGILVGSCVVVLAMFLITAALINYRKHQISIEGRRTVNPILERYNKTHDAKMLMADYTRWRRENHDPQLVYIFTKETVEIFIESHQYKLAKQQLKTMSEMPSTPRARGEFEKYREECLKRMGSK